MAKVCVSNELRKRGIFISPSGVRSVWLRQNLESFKKRLSALERHVAETGAVLTEAQVQALEKKQEDVVAHGEIETSAPWLPRQPGYLLRWHDQGRGADLSADFRRYLLKAGYSQTLYHQDADHGG